MVEGEDKRVKAQEISMHLLKFLSENFIESWEDDHKTLLTGIIMTLAYLIVRTEVDLSKVFTYLEEAVEIMEGQDG